MKRVSIVLFFLLIVAGVWGWFTLTSPPKPLQLADPIRINQGVILGGIDRHNSDVKVYNGIPYASARRWAPPGDPPQWGAVARDVREFGPQCLQSHKDMEGFVNRVIDGSGLPWWKRTLARKFIAAQPSPAEAEECLFVNVRSANVGHRELQPVMVWIHGGAHQAGAGSNELYQANALVEKGVVLVTFNYRLGPFGYLAHPALTEEAGTSGNYGLLDQVAALRWVRNNISTFGGDPDNVTVFGESAGAQSISELMATRLADGLYDKAILESGTSSYNALYRNEAPLIGSRSAEDAGTEFLSSLVTNAATAADLRAIPAAAIISRAEARQDLTRYFLPVVDGRVLTETIGAAIRAGDEPKVPVLAGYNADEGTLFYDSIRSPTVLRPGITGTLEEREQSLAEVFGENPAKALEALYGMETERSWDAGATDMLGDDMFGVHMRFLSKANAAAGRPTWMYFFTRTTPARSQTIGAFHGSEIPFVFGSSSPLMPTSDKDERLADTMQSYWTNFARTGNPNGSGLPEWPRYNASTDEWLVLDHEIFTVAGIRARKLDILEEHLIDRIDAVSRATEINPEFDATLMTTLPVSGGEETPADGN
ncbi:MAG: carboxylesterase family protein [Hyphomonas sp.]|nr:carboxylesterase family protein [Hyphomonas sp.]MCB9960618.1 carboxylesterase family protein [Hyphomonas sp.]